MIDIFSYELGSKSGYSKGYVDGASDVVITGSFTCTDDGSGNITITEDNNG